MLSTGTVVKVIGQREVEAKLLAAAPRILANNAAMVTSMLEYVKPIVVAETPFGPGHFGYHAKDRFTIKVEIKGSKTVGMLMGAIQAYWREFGTHGHFRKGSKSQRAARAFQASMSSGGFGEPAFMTAHKAVSGVKRFVKAYYGGMLNWWRA